MAEKLRVKCPLCGMLSDLDHFLSVRSGKIRIYLQRFGGKVVGTTKGRGSARGFMEYEDVTKSNRELVNMVADKLRDLPLP